MVITHILKNIPDAVEALETLLEVNSHTHTEGAWKDLGVDGNFDHADYHIAVYERDEPDTIEDHLLHAACRLLMTWQLHHELSKQESQEEDVD